MEHSQDFTCRWMLNYSSLIMLLIQSDLIKSVWFVIFPLVDHTLGPIASDSAFCQVSGFFLAVGFESSDVAILLITLHSALYILRPKSGLHPYRRLAYALYIVLPLLAASLAFVGGHGYENTGRYCSLRSDQYWKRLAFSWVPRYVIFVVIMLTYLGIYAYVRSMMVGYPTENCGACGENSKGDRSSDAPSTPRIECHGLVPSTPSSSRRADVAPTGGRPSISSANTSELDGASLPDSIRDARATPVGQDRVPVNWNWSARSKNDRSSLGKHNGDRTPASGSLDLTPRSYSPSKTDLTDGVTSLSPTLNSPRSPRRSHLPATKSGVADHDTPSLDTTIVEMGDSPQTPLPNIFSMGRKSRPCRAENSSTQNILATGAIQDHSEIARNRLKIFRQLRSLFVYPLAYMLTWVFPFAWHIRGYDDSNGAPGPRWLLIVCMASLSMQAAVDSAVFMIREEPWKHTQGGFWVSLKRRLREYRKTGWRKTRVVGRTSEEMVVDGRNARARRKEEMAAERVVRGEQHAGVTGQGGRDWWDTASDGSELGGEGEQDGHAR